jgi:hypothetical protein
MVMDGRLHLSPFSRAHPPRKVLDIATGTGTWAIEMGDKYPEAEIVGTDLSPIQPAFVPPNVRFFVEDSYVIPLRISPLQLTKVCHRSDEWYGPFCAHGVAPSVFWAGPD